jgi:hypothetical protein
MTITNKTVTILGSTAKLSSFTVYPQADGSYVVTANGTATDGASFSEQIATSASFPAGTNVLDNMSAAALQKLRIANGLEV